MTPSNPCLLGYRIDCNTVGSNVRSMLKEFQNPAQYMMHIIHGMLHTLYHIPRNSNPMKVAGNTQISNIS